MSLAFSELKKLLLQFCHASNQCGHTSEQQLPKIKDLGLGLQSIMPYIERRTLYMYEPTENKVEQVEQKTPL